MLKTKILILLLSFCSLLTAQEDYNFLGTIQLSDNSLITYKLNFTLNSDNSIDGRSITDINGAHRTESLISGQLSDDGETLSFKETKNLSTKSNYSEDDFCYVHLTNGKIKLRSKKSILQGHFYGRFSNNELCAEGDLYLVSESFMMSKMEKLEKKIPKAYKDKLDVEEAKKASKLTILNAGESLKIGSSSKAIKLNVWDDAKEDGDRVSIYVNGQKKLDNFTISRKPKSIIIPLDKDAVVEIVAENEGSLPPNSARFSITDDSKETDLETQLNKDKKAIIVINKE